MTQTIERPDVVPADVENEDVIHIWCEKCNTRNPRVGICGAIPEDQSIAGPDDPRPACKRCHELIELHAATLHPGYVLDGRHRWRT